MATKKKETENLPALPGNTFIMPVDKSLPILDQSAVDLLHEDDLTGYEPVPHTLPYVSIRQKPLLDDTDGSQLVPAGSFKMTSKMADDIIDIPGGEGLVVTILSNQLSRVYFEKLEDKQPKCKSNAAMVGIGDPGGRCEFCPLGQFTDGKQPKCQMQYKNLCWDHNSEGLYYVLTIGPSGLRHYNDHRRRLENNKIKVGSHRFSIPEHFIKVRITTQYVAEPAAHFIPVFEIIGQLDKDLIVEAKGTRISYSDLFQRTIEVTEESVNSDAQSNATDTEYSELPDGVTAVDPSEVKLK